MVFGNLNGCLREMLDAEERIDRSHNRLTWHGAGFVTPSLLINAP